MAELATVFSSSFFFRDPDHITQMLHLHDIINILHLPYLILPIISLSPQTNKSNCFYQDFKPNSSQTNSKISFSWKALGLFYCHFSSVVISGRPFIVSHAFTHWATSVFHSPLLQGHFSPPPDERHRLRIRLSPEVFHEPRTSLNHSFSRWCP